MYQIISFLYFSCSSMFFAWDINIHTASTEFIRLLKNDPTTIAIIENISARACVSRVRSCIYIAYGLGEIYGRRNRRYCRRVDSVIVLMIELLGCSEFLEGGPIRGIRFRRYLNGGLTPPPPPPSIYSNMHI